MSTTEAIREKVAALPPKKQEEVLHYVESLSASATEVKKTGEPYEWMKIAMSMNLDGPPDLSEHLDDYLYGDKKNAW
ncbi:MAG: hypothetical protein HY298_10540 [Verrucomicrobia bacterium]|nr:hypothetical protein [Verrucomicrobiota bacterium]